MQELQERKKIRKKERKKKKKPENEADVEADGDVARAETSKAEPGEHEESSDEAAQNILSLSPNPSAQDVAQDQKETAEAAAADGEVYCCAFCVSTSGLGVGLEVEEATCLHMLLVLQM